MLLVFADLETIGDIYAAVLAFFFFFFFDSPVLEYGRSDDGDRKKGADAQRVHPCHCGGG